MICLRCGYCCKFYMVSIIDDPDKGISENNLLCYMGDSKCKHLRGDKIGEYACAIHDKEWYNETPCFQYGQIEENSNDFCRTGTYIIDRQKKGLPELVPQKI